MPRTYHLYGTFTASTNDSAHIDIKQTGKVIGVDFALWQSSAYTTGDQAVLELSYASTLQQSNDANGIIATHASSGFLTTSGASLSATNKWCGPMACEVKQGDRLYINAFEAGSGTYLYRVTVHVV